MTSVWIVSRRGSSIDCLHRRALGKLVVHRVENLVVNLRLDSKHPFEPDCALSVDCQPAVIEINHVHEGVGILAPGFLRPLAFGCSARPFGGFADEHQIFISTTREHAVVHEEDRHKPRLSGDRDDRERMRVKGFQSRGRRRGAGARLVAHIVVRPDVPVDMPLALADPNQLEMAIINLSVNARDAMQDGRTILRVE